MMSAKSNCFQKGARRSAVDENVEVWEAGGDVKPTGVFPEEVWKMILDYLDHSQDIVNVLRAFPALDKAFQSQKPFWLFDQVLPQLMTKHLVMNYVTFSNNKKWTQSQELLKLRLASKRWKKAVDRSLESNTNLLPPPPPQINHSTKSLSIPENHFNDNRMPDFHLGTSIFRTAHQVDVFMETMSLHKGNPFPGSSVLLSNSKQSPYDFNQESKLFIQKALELLGKFGKYVLVLEIQICEYWFNDLQLPKILHKCLSLVPNLKSLTIAGSMYGNEDSESNTLMEENQKLFPSLPNLEKVHFKIRLPHGWCPPKSSWINGVVETYGKNVTNLGMVLNNSWILEKSTHLTNLTELYLLLISNPYDPTRPRETRKNPASIPNLGNLLQGLPNSGKIRKLSLTSRCRHLELNIIDLVELLADYQFETVNLNGLILKTDSVGSGMPVKAATTITSLSIDDSTELGYEFLWWLPNLRFLSVYFSIGAPGRTAYPLNMEKKEEEEEIRCFVDVPLEFLIRRYCLKAYHKKLHIPKRYSIWKDFPNLEMLKGCVEVMPSSALLSVQYVKECGNKAFFGWRPDDMDKNELKDQRRKD